MPQAAVKKRRGWTNWAIWLLPGAVLVIGLGMLARSWVESGPTITISFQTAEGLDPNRTPVKYKNVVIGTVSSVKLSKDYGNVVATVDLDKSAEHFASKGSRFWVVRPRIGAGGVSGVDTLLSGSFIGADIGRSNEPQKHFEGLETPPSVLNGQKGKRFTLLADDLGSLDIGSPVYYRRIQVGHVTSYELDKDGHKVKVQIFVDSPNDRFVTTDTRFWNASGVSVAVGSDGLKVSAESLTSVIAGGIAFDEPMHRPDLQLPAAPQRARFSLFDDEKTALAPPSGDPVYIRMRFEHALRGLKTGAPVEFLGVNVGRVLSSQLSYDPERHSFPLLVGALVYPHRLGHADEQMKAATKAGDAPAGRSDMIGILVQHGLRAQAKTGNILTGQLYISMDFVPHAPKVAFNPDVHPMWIPTVEGGLDKMQEQVGQILDKLQKIPFDSIGKHLNQSLGDLDLTLKQVNAQSLPALTKTLQSAQQTMQTAGNAFSLDSPLQQSLSGSVEEMQRMARSLRVLTDYLGRYPEALLRGRRSESTPVTAPSAAPSSTGSQP